MGTDDKQPDGYLVYLFVNNAPVATNINTSVTKVFTGQCVIIQSFIRRVVF
jgi:hypothetical protein